ncbi:MAG: cyclodeaminase/cyclohydrolase family protein [Phycisphaerales bacterium]|nr:cyclodeaminase/cyclohydrolase family protein [Phycisphaerales bacterium]
MSSDTAAQSIASQSVGAFLESLAAKVPTPGGGASAAITGATAAATAAMVVSYSLGKKSLAECEGINQNAMARLTRARQMFLQLGDEDAEGYGTLNALWKLDKDDPKRIEQWDDAVQGAITPPRAMLAMALELLRLFDKLVSTTNKQLKSDLGVAAVLGEAAARSAAWNVRINIPLLPEDQRDGLVQAVDVMLDEAKRLSASIETGCA